MEDLILLIIIGSVALPLIGAVGWAIFVIFIAKAALQGARQLDQTLPDIERSLRQLKRLPAGRQTAEQAHIAAAIAQAQKQLRDLDQLSRPPPAPDVIELSEAVLQGKRDPMDALVAAVPVFARQQASMAIAAVRMTEWITSCDCKALSERLSRCRERGFRS